MVEKNKEAGLELQDDIDNLTWVVDEYMPINSSIYTGSVKLADGEMVKHGFGREVKERHGMIYECQYKDDMTLGYKRVCMANDKKYSETIYNENKRPVSSKTWDSSTNKLI